MKVEDMRTIDLEFDERLFILLSKDLYRDDYAFLRELCQNSADAGATKINWVFNQEERTISEFENGKGMDYEFCLNDWKKVGKSFKSSDSIGFYGIGRLSVWKIAEKCLIRTNNALVNWDSISRYKVGKTSEITKGLTFKIYLKPDKVLAEWQIKNYLETNVCFENIRILFNNEEIPKITRKFDFKIEMPLEKAIVYIGKPENGWEAFNVFEKGLKVKSEYNSKLFCLVNFNKAIKTLSRESLTISDKEIKEVILKAWKKHINDLVRKFGEDFAFSVELKGYEKSIAYLASLFEDKELASQIPLKGRPLKDYKGFFYSKPSILVFRAEDKGYKVLVIENDDFAKCCELIGMKSLESIRDELKSKVLIKKSDSEKAERILNDGADFLNYLIKLTKELRNKLSTDSEAGEVIKSTEVEDLERKIKEMECSASDEVEVEEGSDKIKFIHGALAFGEDDNPLVEAFQVGKYIVLNLNSELIQKLLETERLDLIEETLTHEFTHQLCGTYHDERFVGVYNALRSIVLKRKAETTALFSNNILVSKISTKYQQASLKIPNSVLRRLQLEKGTEVKVTIESLGKDTENTEDTEESLDTTEKE